MMGSEKSLVTVIVIMDSSNGIINECVKSWVKLGWGRGYSHNLKISPPNCVSVIKGKVVTLQWKILTGTTSTKPSTLTHPTSNPNRNSGRLYLQNVPSQTAIISQLEVTVHLLKGVPASPGPPTVCCQPSSQKSLLQWESDHTASLSKTCSWSYLT